MGDQRPLPNSGMLWGAKSYASAPFYPCGSPMSPRIAIGVVIVLMTAAPPFAFGEPNDPAYPIAVLAVQSGGSVIVAWASGVETPDIFRIYGVRDDGLIFLAMADAAETSATVQGGYPQYAVTTVRNGIESDPAVGLACVTVEPGIPPGIAVGSSCTPKTRLSFRARTP